MRVTFMRHAAMKQALYEEFHTLFNLPLYITVTRRAVARGFGNREQQAYSALYRSDKRLVRVKKCYL